MKNIIQINILIKRILCRPAMIAILLLIPAALITVRLLPDKKQSTEIISGIYIESPDSYTEAFTNSLMSSTTGFTFKIYDSISDMQDDVASCAIDCGYMIPEGFSASMIACDNKASITVYSTAGSSFQNVSCESVYAALLSAYAAHMSVAMFKDRYTDKSDIPGFGDIDYTDIDIEQYITDRFHGYIDNDAIFSIQGGLTDKYSPTQRIVPGNFPVELLVYFSLFICALLGIQSYLKDLDNGIYSALSRYGKIGFCAKNIAAGIIPAAIISFLSLIIYSGNDIWLTILTQTVIISLISAAAAMILSLIFRHYRAFTVAMPFIIICTLLPLLLSQLSRM